MMQASQWQQRERRAPDWPAAAAAGLSAGAILMVVDLLWSISATGSGPWVASRMIAAMVMGPDVMQSASFSLGIVAMALIAHYVLGVIFALVLVAISSPMRLDSTLTIAVVTGAVFGFALYIFNFNVMVRVFPWFTEIRGWGTLLVNIVFGVSAAVLYWKLERRDEAPQPARAYPAPAPAVATQPMPEAMTEVVLTLPSDLARRARSAGLLSSTAMQKLVEEALRR